MFRALCLPRHWKYHTLLNCWSPRNLLCPALSSPTDPRKEWQFRELFVGMWRWCDSSYQGYQGILAMQRSKMIFSGHSCIVPSPEVLQDSPHLPLSGCSSDGGSTMSTITTPAVTNGDLIHIHAMQWQPVYKQNSSGCSTNVQGKVRSKTGRNQTRDLMSHLLPAHTS